jgi:hypothetical protein
MWKEQWARLGRSYELITQTEKGRPDDRNSDFLKDELYSFFQNCYHLKDWLKNDPHAARFVGT